MDDKIRESFFKKKRLAAPQLHFLPHPFPILFINGCMLVTNRRTHHNYTQVCVHNSSSCTLVNISYSPNIVMEYAICMEGNAKSHATGILYLRK